MASQPGSRGRTTRRLATVAAAVALCAGSSLAFANPASASSLTCAILKSSNSYSMSCKGNPLQPYWVSGTCRNSYGVTYGVRGATQYPSWNPFSYGPSSKISCSSGYTLINPTHFP